MQNANNVIHLIVEDVADLSANLKLILGLETAFTVPAGVASKPDMAAGIAAIQMPIARPRDMYQPDLHIDTLKVKRDFR